jgi:hypothetical protein
LILSKKAAAFFCDPLSVVFLFFDFLDQLPSGKNLSGIPPTRRRKNLEKGEAGEVSWDEQTGLKRTGETLRA